MPSAGTDPTRAQAARSLGLSGSLERRIASLERWVPEGPIWVPVGSDLPQVDGDGIRQLLADARRHLQARRWVAAVSAYEHAEHLVDRGTPTLRLALKRQAEARRVAGLRQGSEAKRRQAEQAAQEYVDRARELRRTHPAWAPNSIINQIRSETDNPQSARQIRRHLDAHGVK
jgi:hypothetical protein